MTNMIRMFCVACAALLTTSVVAQDFSLQNTVQLVPDKDTTLLQFKVPIEAQNGLLKVYVFVSYNNIYATLPYVYAPGIEQHMQMNCYLKYSQLLDKKCTLEQFHARQIWRIQTLILTFFHLRKVCTSENYFRLQRTRMFATTIVKYRLSSISFYTLLKIVRALFASQKGLAFYFSG